MASQAVFDAVMARLEANWDQTPITDANGGGCVPARNTPFLSVEFPIANEEQLTVGSPRHNVFREEGAFRIVLSVPIGHRLTPFNAWVDALRSVFRGQTFAGVTTWGAAPSITNARSVNGAYYELSFSVPYRFDFLA
ncbi:phage tail terminator-like protein [Lichenifustis flavocetrariae]|uniref:Phage tail terminator-like protein n=1 Tax=Lichenifustis flavocetrariae TaxID=2949735 RepID=A0AA41YYV2_9HYPH|nr:phage tail terminator-like protein [Lichenifustis flavocetrariae]MCW6509821.1 phage tail terminator-like protein [Lichenifustis flavocetrariae]